MAVKIPVVKEVPLPSDLIKRKGSLDLVGFYVYQQSLRGKFMKFFGNEKYSFDKLAGKARKMVREKEKGDADYFAKKNLEEYIDPQFLKLLFDMAKEYVDEGTNDERKALIQSKVLNNKDKTMAIIYERQNALRVLGENDKFMTDVTKKRKEFEEGVNEVGLEIQELSKKVGSEEFPEQVEKINLRIEKLLNDNKTTGQVPQYVNKLSEIEHNLQNMKQEDEKLRDIKEKEKNMISQMQSAITRFQPGTPECGAFLKKAKSDLLKMQELFKANKIKSDSQKDISEEIEKLEKAHLALPKKAQPTAQAAAPASGPAPASVKDGSKQSDSLDKRQLFLKRYGEDVVKEHKGGFMKQPSITASVEDILDYGKNANSTEGMLKLLNENSELLGGKAYPGNYQIFKGKTNTLRSEWEKIAPTGNTWTPGVKSMKREEILKYIIDSYQAGEWVKG